MCLLEKCCRYVTSHLRLVTRNSDQRYTFGTRGGDRYNVIYR